MYGSELRTCGLGAVVCVLLGAGIGYGWHYLDNGGVRAVAASASTPLAKQDAPSPPSEPFSSPGNPSSRWSPSFLGYRNTHNQPEATRDALRATPAVKHQPDRLGATSPQA